MVDSRSTVYISIDTETTGLVPSKGARLTEIAAVKIVESEISHKDIFQELIDPKCRIPLPIAKMTGITNEMVKGKPACEEVLIKLSRWVTKDSVLIFQNASFDLQFLDYYSVEFNVEPLENAFMDTMEMFRALFPGKSGLDSILDKLGIVLPHEMRHRATGDAVATALAFSKMKTLIPERDLPFFLHHRKINGNIRKRPYEE
jgi:DNA polymerase-3 subunit epsilon